MDISTSFFIGLGASVAAAPPVEWTIHKHILHVREDKRKSKFIKGASYGHQDVHHAAYRIPAHYYRDLSNEDTVVHFGKGDVGVIAAVGAGIGALPGIVNLAYNHAWDKGDLGYILGFTTGAISAYAAYEYFHHQMHVIGHRRMQINKHLGDLIQEGKPDGRLRFSKPLLDDICGSVEDHIDSHYPSGQHSYLFDNVLIDNLGEQLSLNIQKTGAYVSQFFGSVKTTLDQLTNLMMEEEREKRSGLSLGGKILYRVQRANQRFLRNWAVFEFLDNHHFMHHAKYYKNLNVVFVMADKLFGTMIDSSKEYLNKFENLAYWLCPNSPDTARFEKPLRNI